MVVEELGFEVLELALLWSTTAVGVAVCFHSADQIFGSLGWGSVAKVSVVRVIDYVHYPEEKAVYLGRFATTVWTIFRWKGLDAGLRFILLVSAGTAQLFVQELLMQVQSRRAMRLEAYAGTASKSKPFILLGQAFFEGGVYFANLFGVAIHLADRSYRLAAGLAFSTVVLPFVHAWRGDWPRPIDYGASVLSRREITRTLPARLVQLSAALVTAKRRADERRRRRGPLVADCPVLPAFAAVQFLLLLYYFLALAYQGRSYVEIRRPGADRPSKPTPLVAALATAYRACEAVIGGFFLAVTVADLTGHCP